MPLLLLLLLSIDSQPIGISGMLSLKDLADKIAAKLQETLFLGAVLHGKRKKSDLCPCKILKVLEEGTVKTKYEVAWLDRNKKVIETAIVNRNDLIWKKSPFSRNSLKPFIRKSTYRSFPWVLHDKLAEKYQISRDPPQDLEGKVFIQDGIVYNKRKKDATNGQVAKKKGVVFSARPNNPSKRSESSHSNMKSKKTGKKKNMNAESQAENAMDVTKKEALILLRDEKNTAAKRSSKEQRREYFEREIEKRILHTNPLGKDRDYNRYWLFKRDGRMFVESSDSKQWGYYCCKEEIDLLMGSLNPKGERERALQKQVERFYSRI
ncbi:hypothetical protein OIU85_003544, partial [Salix viminalis]